MENLTRCRQRSRICDDACSWREWTTTREEGECESGETRVDRADCDAGMRRTQTCSDECLWENSGECEGACGGTPRTSPADAEEICIPAGPFYRGDETFSDATPVREVTLSAYFIDRYPVTNERYVECMDAGACSEPGTGGMLSMDDPARVRHPVQSVTHAQAEAFCSWDGGRRLATEAEWEKAARGPSPRMQPYVWDGADYRCDLVPNFTCGYDGSEAFIDKPVDGLPGSRSYYGTELQVGGGLEWVSDWYSATYYSDDESLTDPAGPASGTRYVVRGEPQSSVLPDNFRVGRRWSVFSTNDHSHSVIRCARSAPGE